MSVNVTKTFLPPMDEYQSILARAWEKGWITNRGILVRELEDSIKEYLKVSNVLLMTNGTLPIQIAIKALDLDGDIITTPFSYVATTSSIVWEGCNPVFVDIHPDHLTIDANKIEESITERTSAIIATHVYGNPCDVERISQIAEKHNLKVIYDAAHCFGVNYKGHSIFEYGDVSTCSFHATKVFHTGEGGALFSKDPSFMDKVFYHHNFGHKGKEEFQGLGINAKISELQAAMGLAVLPYMEQLLSGRKKVIEMYQEHLSGEFKYQTIRENTTWNFSYFPVIISSERKLENVLKVLNESDIFPRRYFYPSLDTLPYINNAHCPVARDIAERILCLPLYYDMPEQMVVKISKIVNNHS